MVARRLLALVTLLASTSCIASSPRINLEVDATDVVHGIQHVRLILPAHAGPMTLAYPEWIPGEHRPTGPITQLVNLHFEAGGDELPWRRDARDAFLFHLTAPPQTRAIAVRFDFFSPPRTVGPGFGETPDATTHLLVLAFNQLILYPADDSANGVEVSTRVRIPAGWKADSALPLEVVSENEISLPVVSLYTLVDSPLLAGEYFRSIPLGGGSTAARISIAADRLGDLVVSEGMIGSLDRLLLETAALFGPGHYRRYVWLVALGDRLGHDGLEHHESSDVREVEGLFTDPADAIEWRLFPHEYVHSWNGKYRRPDGLVTRNYQQPMIDDLLWVYEGLTRYYGDFVLSARSGFASGEQARAYLAYVAALMARARPGRDWRSLADTAAGYPAYAQASAEWESVRRGSDFYSEMLLVWLEADTLIRERTRGQRSLDDFCRRFFSGPERDPAVRPYNRGDLIGELNRIAALDWDGFFRSRVAGISPRASLTGIEASGWQLDYDDSPNEFLVALAKINSVDDLSLSLGVRVRPDGTVVDVVTGSPAFTAGIAPAMRLMAIDAHAWTTSEAQAAIVRAETSRQPLELQVTAGDLVRSPHVEYYGGLQYPHLRRVTGKPDLLSLILAPRGMAEERR